MTEGAAKGRRGEKRTRRHRSFGGTVGERQKRFTRTQLMRFDSELLRLGGGKTSSVQLRAERQLRSGSGPRPEAMQRYAVFSKDEGKLSNELTQRDTESE
jgi:hypothetical protein